MPRNALPCVALPSTLTSIGQAVHEFSRSPKSMTLTNPQTTHQPNQRRAQLPQRPVSLKSKSGLTATTRDVQCVIEYYDCETCLMTLRASDTRLRDMPYGG
jgi:hypothetical protein